MYDSFEFLADKILYMIRIRLVTITDTEYYFTIDY